MLRPGGSETNIHDTFETWRKHTTQITHGMQVHQKQVCLAVMPCNPSFPETLEEPACASMTAGWRPSEVVLVGSALELVLPVQAVDQLLHAQNNPRTRPRGRQRHESETKRKGLSEPAAESKPRLAQRGVKGGARSKTSRPRAMRPPIDTHVWTPACCWCTSSPNRLAAQSLLRAPTSDPRRRASRCNT